MIKKFDEYLIERNFQKLAESINLTLENVDLDKGGIVNKFTQLVKSAFSKGKDFAIPVIKAFFDIIHWNRNVAYTFYGVLILASGMKLEEIIQNFANSKSDEEMVRKANMDITQDTYKAFDVDGDKVTKEEDDKREAVVLDKGNLVDFLNAISKRESSHDPGVVNSAGYIGLYQFGKGALTDLEIYKNKKRKIVLDSRAFLRNPNIFPVEEQNKAMLRYLRINKEYLEDEIREYVGRRIAGILITESGLLAGSHLLGHGGIKTFLKSNGNKIPKDGNNTPITEYIQKFGGYDLKELETKSLSSVENINPVWKKGSKFKSWRKVGNTQSPNK